MTKTLTDEAVAQVREALEKLRNLSSLALFGHAKKLEQEALAILSAPDAPPDEEAVRKEFEAWARAKFPGTEVLCRKNLHSSYLNHRLDLAWLGYRAARGLK